MGVVDFKLEAADSRALVLMAFAHGDVLPALRSKARLRLAYGKIIGAVLERVPYCREGLRALPEPDPKRSRDLEQEISDVVMEQATYAAMSVDDSIVRAWSRAMLPADIVKMRVPVDAIRIGGFRACALHALLMVLDRDIAIARARRVSASDWLSYEHGGKSSGWQSKAAAE